MVLRVAVAVVVVSFAPPASAQVCKYKIEVLAPSIPEYDWCGATGLSDKGHVVGTCSQDVGEETRAFVYRNGVTTNVGVLGGFNQGRGYNVNNHGDVVGQSGLSFNWEMNDAFVWSNGVMDNIEQWATFPMGDTVAYDINDAGEIVGTDDYDGLAVYWVEGSEPLYLPGGDYPTRANAINEASQIAGSAYFGASQHAVRWDNFELVDLGAVPGGGWTEATDIADNGFITGTGYIAGAGGRAFFYDPADPGFKVIGTFGGLHSYGLGVSSLGQVVGFGYDAANDWVGFVWRKGQLYDLTNLLHANPTADPWDIKQAKAINEKGQILVLAYNSTSSAYLLLHPQSCMVSSSLACCPF